MFKNYLTIAWRSIWKNKLFSLINITSLAIGLSASFVIGLLVYYDLTFDKFHKDGELIYRITTEFITPEGNFYNCGVPSPLRNAINNNSDGINTINYFFTTEMLRVKNIGTGKVFKDPDKIIFADAQYFRLFDYKWLAGGATQLSEPNEMILTEDRAKKYFPNQTPQEIIGNTLVYNDSITVNISGIVANIKYRSDLIFEEFISLKTANQTNDKNSVFNDEWNSTNSAVQLFVKIDKNVRLLDFQTQLNKLAKEHEDALMLSFGQRRKFHLQPLSDLHFNPDYGIFDFSEHQADKSILISLAFIALFLLLLGIVNFINLNTAQASRRAKEIGIRKTLGSSKKQLIFQFLGESFLLTIVAAIISIVFAAWLLQLFADFTPKGLNFELFREPLIISLILLLLIIVTVLSGFYPAIVLSRFNPISVLNNQLFTGKNKAPLRKSLTVFQFVIAQVFIIATILVGKQIHYLTSKDMGFQTKTIAYIRTPWHNQSMEKRIRLIDKVKTMPQIEKISLGGQPPASFSTHLMDVKYFDDGNETNLNLELLYGDKNYLDLYGIKLLAGRPILNDTIKEFIINKTCMKKLGIENPADAVGKFIVSDSVQIPIVGVMADFNQRSLTSEIKPMALVSDYGRENYSQFNTIHFDFQNDHPETWPSTIAQIEKTWKAIYPEDDFKLIFVDDTILRFYTQERKTATLLNWATGLSILISCLGLFGLVIHTTERRTKEIGIRKVLGASLLQLNVLLTSEFLVLVGIAFLIAAPIAWYGIHNWLEGFAYKTSMSWWVFVVSGLAMILFAVLIMSIKTFSAAKSNPVESLKTE
ncbi:MAG: FtsX-like permease family protein [Lutibacter sp.]|jgi:ABC-type antimicrobial peptide transport system permease subunit